MKFSELIFTLSVMGFYVLGDEFSFFRRKIQILHRKMFSFLPKIKQYLVVN